MRDSPRRANWRAKRGKNGSWIDELTAVSPRLAQLIAAEQPCRDALELIVLLRNSVHGEGLSSVMTIEDPARLDDVQHRLLLPPDDNRLLLSAMQRLGGHAVWGVEQIDVDAYSLSVPTFLETLLPKALSAMSELMTLTPVENLAGRRAAGTSPVLSDHDRIALQCIRLLSGLAGPLVDANAQRPEPAGESSTRSLT